MLQCVTLWNNYFKERHMISKDIFTVEEVAEYLRIHPYTVRRLARTGKLPGFKIGGQWRFKKDELNKSASHKKQ